MTGVMQPAWYLALIPGLPLVGTLVAALARNRWPKHRLALAASVAVGGSFAAALAALVNFLRLPEEGYRALEFTVLQWGLSGEHSISLGFLGDGLSLWFALVVTGVG